MSDALTIRSNHLVASRIDGVLVIARVIGEYRPYAGYVPPENDTPIRVMIRRVAGLPQSVLEEGGGKLISTTLWASTLIPLTPAQEETYESQFDDRKR